MNRAVIIESVSESTGLTRSEIGHVLEQILDLISEELADGGTVELRRFGTFRCVRRAARNAVNPRTKAPVQVPERTVPTFKPSPILRAAVKDVKV